MKRKKIKKEDVIKIIKMEDLMNLIEDLYNAVDVKKDNTECKGLDRIEKNSIYLTLVFLIRYYHQKNISLEKIKKFKKEFNKYFLGDMKIVDLIDDGSLTIKLVYKNLIID